MNPPLVLYLRLTPEFGGTRFGPFEGVEVVLGSEGTRCDITLPQSLGVLAIHVRVMRQADNSLILAPAERTATLFLWKQQARAPVQVDTPTAVRPGDSFALVTENGPRFILELDELPAEIRAARDKKPGLAKQRLSAASFGKEAKRQAFTRLLVTGPGQLVAKAYTFIKSGTFLQPRYIFLGITILAGYVWAGGLTCKGKKQAKLLESQSAKLETCNKALGFAEGGDDQDWTIPELVVDILGEKNGIGVALEEDAALKDAVWKEAGQVLQAAKGYAWLYDSRKSKVFADFRERIAAEEGLDSELIRVLPYIAVDRTRHESEWNKVEDSVATDVCQRGIAHLTYRQGLHLGLQVAPDAYVPKAKVESYRNDKPLHEQALRATLEAAGMGEVQGDFETSVDDLVSGEGGCIRVEGGDDRLQADRLVARFVDQLGAEADLVPAPDASIHATTARLGKLFAADLPDVDYRDGGQGMAFTDYPLGTVTGGMGSKGVWVLNQVAVVIARAVVLPCEAAVNPKVDKKEAEAVFGTLPPLTQCLMLDWRLRSGAQ